MNTYIQAALIDGIINELLDGNVDTAIVRLVRMKREIDSKSLDGMKAEIKAELDAKFGKLPPYAQDKLPKVKPIPGKRPKSIDVNCPTCGARKGKPCFQMSNPGRSAIPTDVVREGYHAARTVAAKEVSG